MKYAILIIGGILLLQTLPVSAGTFLETFDNFAFLEEDLTVGSVGFGLAGYTARFDNLKITGEEVPNHGGLSVQPQAKLAVTWGQLKQAAH